jgi:hypothetical protein
MEDARITVKRRRRFVASAESFRVMLDGAEQGRLWPGDDLTVDTSPGRHELHLTTDGRVRSRPVDLELSPGDEAGVLSSSPKDPVGNLFRIIFRPAQTIEIELIAPTA